MRGTQNALNTPSLVTVGPNSGDAIAIMMSGCLEGATRCVRLEEATTARSSLRSFRKIFLKIRASLGWASAVPPSKTSVCQITSPLSVRA